ncbi:UNVERIFIED_CONTAM: hypothetical protein NCL1_15770 [Trichonephila clavipes]
MLIHRLSPAFPPRKEYNLLASTLPAFNNQFEGQFPDSAPVEPIRVDETVLPSLKTLFPRKVLRKHTRGGALRDNRWIPKKVQLLSDNGVDIQQCFRENSPTI